MAEDTGFEPAEPFGSTVFKTAAIDHSANPPLIVGVILRVLEKKDKQELLEISYL